jgi:uncharacterized protein YjbJ (UPF0337 family)
MTDQRIEGAATEFEGKAKNGLGELLGDSKLQLDGRLDQAKGAALNAYGQAMDKLDSFVEYAPPSVQGHARSTIAAARKRPLLTTAIVAGLGLLLLGGRRRRR